MIFVLSGAIELSFGGPSYKLNSGDCVSLIHMFRIVPLIEPQAARALVVTTA